MKSGRSSCQASRRQGRCWLLLIGRRHLASCRRAGSTQVFFFFGRISNFYVFTFFLVLCGSRHAACECVQNRHECALSFMQSYGSLVVRSSVGCTKTHLTPRTELMNTPKAAVKASRFLYAFPYAFLLFLLLPT
ncbi:hypothetical protein T492DRAFT_1067969 [Pavlovales sp. CCMP2436]|nr:hypothetical protein T492DRAFT_1067969 [Pavlovales sp. CCMP2436]